MSTSNANDWPNMQSIKFTYWQHDDAWMGYLQDAPEYLARGWSLAELELHLLDLYQDLSSGVIPDEVIPGWELADQGDPGSAFVHKTGEIKVEQ